MINLLKSLFKFSDPRVAAMSWLSIFFVAIMVVVFPGVSRSAFGAGGDDGTVQTQNGGSLIDQIDKVLQQIWGDGGSQAAKPNPTPDPLRAARATKRIGIQAGHWRYQESPPPFNTQTGTSGGGKTEPEVTLDIAQRAAKILQDMGYSSVDILPAWFPTGYSADAVVAIHADGAGPQARGFFADRSGNSTIPDVADKLVSTLDTAYAAATGLTFQNRSTEDSHYYYGYNRVQPKTPMALIETGFLTNEQDRQIIVGDPDKAAQGIANGIDKFLMQQ